MKFAGGGPTALRQRLRTALLAQLRQGTGPRELALTVALGAVLGLFPILGATTALCALAGIGLRLNQPLIQAVNYAVSPLQLALLLPFYRAGEWLFASPPVPIFSVSDLVARFEASPLQFLVDYGRVGLYGIAVWALLAVPAAVLLYAGLRIAARRLVRRSQAASRAARPINS